MSAATDDFPTATRNLLRAIEAQQGFTAQQTARRGKLYFVWDFVLNTLKIVENPASPREAKSDALQRSMFAEVLINDTTGKLAIMTGGDTTPFDAAVRDQAKAVASKAGEWGRAEGLVGA